MKEKLLFYIVRGMRLFGINLSSNVFSLLTVTTIIFLYGLFSVLGSGLNGLFANLSGTPNVRVYLSDASAPTVKSLMDVIVVQEQVAGAEFYDSEASRDFVMANVENVNYLDKFSSEFFPNFIDVELKPSKRDEASLLALSEVLGSLKGVDTVSHGGKWTEHFRAFGITLKTLMALLGALLAVSVSVVLFNTVKLTMFRFKDEITVYNLVGASRPFVAFPFLMANMFESMIAGGAASTLLGIFVHQVNTNMLEPVGMQLMTQPEPMFYAKLIGFLVLMSLVSGFISVSLFMDRVASINEK